METQKIRRVSIAIFYDSLKNVIVQERGSHSKNGEKYGFWGGSIEEGESPKEAIDRELREELNYTPDNIDFWLKHAHVVADGGKYDGWLIELHVFLSPITKSLETSKIEEGSGMSKFNIDEAISKEGFSDTDKFLLEKLKVYLNW